MINETMIKKKLDELKFYQKLKNYSINTIECIPHSFFRFSEEQREKFTCEFIKNFLLNQQPIFVGLQFNGRYSVFYTYENGRLLKVILIFISDKIRVITFYTIEKHQLPKV